MSVRISGEVALLVWGGRAQTLGHEFPEPETTLDAHSARARAARGEIALRLASCGGCAETRVPQVFHAQAEAPMTFIATSPCGIRNALVEEDEEL